MHARPPTHISSQLLVHKTSKWQVECFQSCYKNRILCCWPRKSHQFFCQWQSCKSSLFRLPWPSGSSLCLQLPRRAPAAFLCAWQGPSGHGASRPCRAPAGVGGQGGEQQPAAFAETRCAVLAADASSSLTALLTPTAPVVWLGLKSVSTSA